MFLTIFSKWKTCLQLYFNRLKLLTGKRLRLHRHFYTQQLHEFLLFSRDTIFIKIFFFCSRMFSKLSKWTIMQTRQSRLSADPTCKTHRCRGVNHCISCTISKSQVDHYIPLAGRIRNKCLGFFLHNPAIMILLLIIIIILVKFKSFSWFSIKPVDENSTNLQIGPDNSSTGIDVAKAHLMVY